MRDNGHTSTLQLAGSVASDLAELVGKEIELARHEVLEAVGARVRAAVAMAVAGVLALLALPFLGLALAVALDGVMPVWASRLLVAGAFLVLAGLAVVFAKRRAEAPSLKPERTIESVKEDVEWARAQLRR